MPAAAKQQRAKQTGKTLKPLPAPPPSVSRKVSRETLINRLNCLHFQSGTLLAILIHTLHGQQLKLRVAPAISTQAQQFSCRWVDLPPDPERLKSYRLNHLQIADGQNVLRIGLDKVKLSDEGLSGELPEVGEELSLRQFMRYPCTDVDVQVIQNGSVFTGCLDDFNAAGFRLELTAQPPQTFQWLTDSDPLTITMNRDGQVLLSTQGKIVRRQGDRHRHTVVVAPEVRDLRRFPAKSFRARRFTLSPSPTLRFKHPLSGRKQRLEVLDLSGSGCAVREQASTSGLLPGMTIADAELCFADTLSFHCKVQVVYRREEDSGRTGFRAGLAFLDMEVSDHNRLLHLIHQTENHRQMICSHVDVEALLEFFFTSGFIYPQKYQALQSERDSFPEAYRRLYQDSPRIARHYLFQDNDVIQGHMSMLRMFSNSWMIHHHAAGRQQGRQTGLDVLRLVGESVNEAQSLYSTHMEQVFCYYRPENRFPQKVFGGVARHYDDRSQCSIDSFAYFHYRKEFDMEWKDGGDWALTPAQADDLHEFHAWYAQESGGLLPRALDLTSHPTDIDDLQDGYRQSGFDRQHLKFVLKHQGEMIALFMVLKTQVGLNLSNLANAITVIMTDPDKLSREAFFTSISMLASKYPVEEIPVLVYPDNYPQHEGIDIEKIYNLWILDCRNLDPYFEFCNNYFRRLKRGEGESTP